jgi:hypothetical protein
MIVFFNQKQHLQSIVDLHYKELPWSVNSRLGKEHLFEIYKKITNLPSSFGFVYVVNEQIVGFSLFSTNNIEMRNALEESFRIKDFIKILKLSFAEPNILIYAIESKFITSIYLKKFETKAEWIAWIVDRDHPLSHRAAIICFFRTKKFFREHNQPYFVGQIDKRSKESNKFVGMMKKIEMKKFFYNNVYCIKS